MPDFSPLVSIVIPVYNRGNLIGETLDSVLKQSYLNWECLIIDDGSEDGTANVVKNYCEKDRRFHFYPRSQDNLKGASACRNYGIKNSKGSYLQFLDSDDLLHEEKLENQLKFLENKKVSALAICKWGYFTHPTDFKKRLKHTCHSFKNFNSGMELLKVLGRYNEILPVHAYLIPKELISKAGLWNEKLSTNDDAEFFTRIILNSEEIVMVPEAKVFYRINNHDKLSEFDSKDKIESSIYSWKLIESYLKKNKYNQASGYIAMGKKNLYDQIKKEHIQVVKENYSFFKPFIPLHKRILIKLF